MAPDAHREPTARRFMTWLLRSPFSGLLDESVMLLTVRGRPTGTEYALPVQYAEESGTIWVFPGHQERKTWWRNLVDESPVRVRLRGHEFDALAQALEGRANPLVVEEGLAAYVRRYRAVARRFGVLGEGAALRDEHLRETAKGVVMVRIVPTEAWDVRGEQKAWLSTVAANLAEVLWRQGKLDEVERFTAMSREAAAADDWISQMQWRATQAKFLADRGELDDAEHLVREAVEVMDRTDNPSNRGDARMSLAYVLRKADRQEEAAAAAREALGFYERKGDIADSARARALLAEIGV